MKAGFTTFSLRYSSDEAYATLAVPVTVDEVAEAEVDAEAGADADADEDVVAVDEEDEEDELLQAAAVRPRHAMPTTAANRLADVRNLSIP